MNIVTLKRPVAVQVENPMTGRKETWLAKYLKVRETLGLDPITAFCTDIARIGDAGRVDWYEDWYAREGAAVTVQYPRNNIEGEQL